MLMGCILSTLTENSFESLKNCLRLRHTGERVAEDVVSHEGIMQASARREQKRQPLPHHEIRPQALCKPRGRGTWAAGAVTSNEGDKKPFLRSALPAGTHWVPAAPSSLGLAATQHTLSRVAERRPRVVPSLQVLQGRAGTVLLTLRMNLTQTC